MQTPAAASSSQRTIGSAFPTATGHTRSGSRAATARRIHSLIRRSEFERNGLDTCLALAGRRGERSLPRRQSGNGVAARRFRRIDAKEFACPGGSTLAADGRPSPRNVAGDPALRAAGHPRRMAAEDPVWRQPLRHRLRRVPAGRPPPSEELGADKADATWAFVLCDSDRAWRRTDAGADLSWTLQALRPR